MDFSALPETVKKVIRPVYYKVLYWQIRLRNFSYLFQGKKPRLQDPKKIPIIINNRNRVSTLKLLIEALERRGYYNIYIIDNNSTYPPLLEYYENCKYPVFRLNQNIGHLAIWKTDIYRQFVSDYYVYTDSDVVPIEECPDDFMDVFLTALRADKKLQKVGFSLKIDDLPDTFKDKNKVIEWEKKFFERKASPMFYRASVDTTFALYRPGMKGGASYLKMYRSDYPYQARHLPWYIDSKNLSEEEAFYISSASTSTHWTKGLSK